MAINREKLLKKADKKRRAEAAETAKYNKYHEKALHETDIRKKRSLFARAEKHQIKANAGKVRAKQLTERADGKINDREWKRIGTGRRNHRMYDMLSAVITRFRPRNPLREEGMSFDRKLSGQNKHFENKGRIFLGGTKAMNRFVDEQGRDWLCKEAVTCVGTKKPMGALVTEAASRLQEKLCPEAAVRSFVYRDARGEVCGSLQERLDIPSDSFDLFKWQTAPDRPLPGGMTSQILREHVTDWLLCNYDTKGENFLVDASGVLRGIDKEQAFSYLDDDKTSRMSRTYSPNPNTPLYNTVFDLYAKGKIDLDLGAVQPYVKAAMEMSSDEYLGLFKDVVDAKCKSRSARDEMNRKILERRDGMEAEYSRFFAELQAEREKNLGVTQASPQAEAGGAGSERVAVIAEKETAETYRRHVDLSAKLHPAREASPKSKDIPAPQKTREERTRDLDEPTK